MNTAELAQYFREEGFNSANYSINTRGSDVFCLINDERKWSVFYTERGRDEPAVFTSDIESEACLYYLGLVKSIRQDHCVGFFKSKEMADRLRTILQERGINTTMDRIPYGGPNDPRFRVFVVGKDIFITQNIVGNVPLVDE